MAAILAILMLVLVAAPAAANVPSPGNSTVPEFVPVVGTRDAPADPAPDPSGAYEIVIRDFTNTPIQGSHVWLDFTACTDMKLCDALVNGQIVDCSGGRIDGVTDENGVIVFHVLGAGLNDGNGTTQPAGIGCVLVVADGVNMRWSLGVTAVLYDQNGALPGGANDGVEADDLDLAVLDVLETRFRGAPYRGRSAYAGDVRYWLSVVDLAYCREILLRSRAGDGSGTGCADASGARSYCP